MAAPGTEKEQALRQAGFSDTEISQWRDQTTKQLNQAGFSGKEVQDYFGVKEPDMSATKAYFEKNLKAFNDEKQPEVQGPKAELQGQPETAKTWKDAINAGWQMSVSGLMVDGHKPDMVVPNDAPRSQQILSSVVAAGADVPEYLAGGLAGARLLGPIGARAGAFALPAAMRKILMDHYEKGDIHNFQDFWERTTGTFMEAAKGAATGLAMGAAGKVAGNVLKPLGPMLSHVGQFAAETASMVTAGKALEGQTPNADDFLNGAATLLILGGAAKATGIGLEKVPDISAKLRETYYRTGLKPAEVIEQAKTDPTITQDLLSSNVDFPKALESFSEVEGPKTEPVKASKDMKELNPTLSPEFSKPDSVEAKEDPAVTEIKAKIEKLDAHIEEMQKLPDAKRDEKAYTQAINDRDELTDRWTELKNGTTEEKPDEKVEKPELTEAEQRIQDKIKPSGKQESEPLDFDKLKTATIDDLHPLKVLEQALKGGKISKVSDSPYDLGRLTRASAEKASVFLDTAPFEFNDVNKRVPGVKSFEDIIKPFESKEDLNGFRRFAVASRAVELSERGIETGIAPEDAQAVVKLGQAKYGKAMGELVEYQNAVLKYLKDSGVLSDDSFEKMKEANRSFVPFFRLMEESNGKGGPGGGLKVSNPIKGIVGSDRDIIDPLESVVRNTHMFIALAERNRSLSALADLAKKAGERGEEFMERVATPMKAIELSKDEVGKMLEAHGIDRDSAEGMTVFRPKGGGLEDDQIAIFKDGKREVYTVDPEVAKAVQSLDRESMNLVMNLLSVPAKMLRVGAVHTPDFLGRHFFRDQINASVLSKNGYVPFVDFMNGLGAILKDGEDFERFRKSGGMMSSMVAIDRDYIEKNISKLSQETGLMDKVTNLIKSPLEIMQVAAENMSNATRMGEFLRATKGKTDTESTFAGGLAARDVTLDYQRIGANTRALSMITAFFNAHVQGMSRYYDEFKANPMSAALKCAPITAISALLWSVNHQDPRWNDIPRWEKDLFWIVMTKDHIFRIPKPFELGIIFGSLPERVLEAFAGNDSHPFKGFGDSVSQAAMPNYMPTALLPMAEVWANKSIMTGHSIIPSELEKVKPEYQYTPYTSETAKGLAKIIGYIPKPDALSKLDSPLGVDNFIRAWTGNLGAYALKLADKALTASGAVSKPPGPAATLSDIPFVKAFVVRYPSADAQSIQDFHDRYNESQQVVATIQHLASQGDMKNLQKEYLLKENQNKLIKLNGISESLSFQNATIRKIYANPDMSPNDKRQLIDSLYTMMILETRDGNKTMDDFDKAMKSR